MVFKYNVVFVIKIFMKNTADRFFDETCDTQDIMLNNPFFKRPGICVKR